MHLKSYGNRDFSVAAPKHWNFVTPATEPKGPGLAEPAEVPSEQICEQELTPSPEMGASAWPVEDQSPIQQQLLPRRSGRVTGPPERFSDYVTT